jgi:hypothetical protein
LKGHRTIVVADHHKSVFVCQVLDRETGEVVKATLGSRRQELEPFLAELARPALVCVEACRAWEWVSDLCEELGVDLRLVNPSKMPEIWRSTKQTDRADVEVMIQRLQVMGELPESHRMTRPQRELRSLTRRLGDFRQQRRRILNQIHAIIDSNGMPAKKESFAQEPWRQEMKAKLSVADMARGRSPSARLRPKQGGQRDPGGEAEGGAEGQSRLPTPAGDPRCRSCARRHDLGEERWDRTLLEGTPVGRLHWTRAACAVFRWEGAHRTHHSLRAPASTLGPRPGGDDRPVLQEPDRDLPHVPAQAQAEARARRGVRRGPQARQGGLGRPCA